MGSPEEDPYSQDYELPVHTVTFDYSFEMMTTEVTQGMWEEVMGTSVQYQHSLAEFDYGLSGTGADYPMYYVSWNDCQDFVDAMNALDPAYEYRLPSESEWEYCCRAGTTTRFYWGDDPDLILIDSYAWYVDHSWCETHPVAQLIANAWGLYDMTGNVWEWCQDYYRSNYIEAPVDGSPWMEPSGTSHVQRGGSYSADGQYCRSASRQVICPGGSDYDLGFRLARSAR
jgi:formylglycine-generating enzyme required for sulfatase activity